MQVSEQKREKIQKELESEASSWQHKERYGLFSYLASHGFGAKDPNTGEIVGPNGAVSQTGTVRSVKSVKTSSKNFQGGRPKSAVLGIKGFSKPAYLSGGDQYVDPGSIMKFRDCNKDKIKEVHGKAFRPSNNGPKVIKAPYKYVSENMDPTEAGHKRGNSTAPFETEGLEGDQAGRGKGDKFKNFMTNPAKKGYGATTHGHLFSHPKYMSDPFEYPNTVASMERAHHRDRFLEGPFQLTYKKRDHFTPNYKQFRVPGGKSGYRPQTAGPTFSPPFLRSDLPKVGYNKTINRFPDYIEEREGENAKRPETAHSAREPVWRYNPKELSRPTPSINHYNSKNNIAQPRQKF